MKCTIPGSNVKVFVRAIHCLGKIGDELYFEPSPDGLALRTVNSSRSAFASFLFIPSFFLQYKDGSERGKNQDAEEEDCRCKVAMRSILSVFRSPASVEKNVERCKISLDMADARLVFKLHCRHGIIKTHSLAFIECETLQAIVSKESCSNKLTTASKVLCDAVVNFQNALEEVTMIASEEKFILKNFVEDETDPSKVVHTQLSLVPREFDVYQIDLDSAITFCLKEFRAILSFAELTTLPLTIHFDKPGSPVVFTIDSEPTFEGTFVLATLSEPEAAPPGSQALPPSVQARPPNPPVKQASSRGKSKQNNKAKPPNGHAPHRKGLKRGEREPSDGEDAQEEVIDITADVTTVQPRPAASSGHRDRNHARQQSPPRSPQPSTSREEPGSPVFPSRPVRKRPASEGNGEASTPPRQTAESPERPSSPVFLPRDPARQAAAALNSSVLAHVEENASEDRSVRMELQPGSDDDDDDDDDETIPGTPPSKKFRSLFFGSQSSSVPSQPRPTPVVLAADTDDED